MKTVFVTGGTGFIGSHIVEALVANGHNVIVFTRKGSSTKFIDHLGENVSVIRGSYNDLSGIERAMKECDTVIHNAGIYQGSDAASGRNMDNSKSSVKGIKN